MDNLSLMVLNLLGYLWLNVKLNNVFFLTQFSTCFQLEAAENKIYVDVGMTNKLCLNIQLIEFLSFFYNLIQDFGEA